MKLKFAKVDPRAVIPTRAKPGDAGLDLTAIDYKYDSLNGYYEYSFGLAVEIPEGYVGFITPRSSISNKDMMLTNSIGTIDSGYRGPLSARFKMHRREGYPNSIYQIGDRVAQLVVVPCVMEATEEVSYDELTKTERGTGGFGSSGS